MNLKDRSAGASGSQQSGLNRNELPKQNMLLPERVPQKPSGNSLSSTTPSSNELQTGMDLIRKQSETIKEQDKQIQELSSLNSVLTNELQEKSAMIIALNEQIGRLHRSDLELKKAEELRTEADTILASAENERSIAERAMDRAVLLKADADAQTLENEQERELLETTIEKQAEKKAIDKVKIIRERYDAMEAKYGTAFGLTIFYGILITVLRVVNSAPARENIAGFLLGIVGIPVRAIRAFAEWADGQTVYDGFFAAKVIVIVLLLILLVIIFVVIIGWFCKRIAAYADACTGVIALTGLASVVFLAETLTGSPINPGLLYLLIMAGYLGLRSFFEWEDENGTKRDILIMARSLGIGILVAIGLLLLMKWAK